MIGPFGKIGLFHETIIDDCSRSTNWKLIGLVGAVDKNSLWYNVSFYISNHLLSQNFIQNYTLKCTTQLFNSYGLCNMVNNRALLYMWEVFIARISNIAKYIPLSSKHGYKYANSKHICKL